VSNNLKSNTTIHKQFGQNISNRRREKNMSQQELAEAIGLSVNQLSSIETGKSGTRIEVIAKLCTVLDITPDYLLLGCLHSNNVSKNFEDIVRLLDENHMELLYNIAVLIKDFNQKYHQK